jgi:hypothetical protein
MPGGEVVWSLWEHTKSWPGAAPARMAYAVVVAGNGCAAPVADGTPCQDGDACTVSDTCQGGVCVPGAALACDDANPCTTDGCDPAWGCVHGWTTDPCDDGSACTAKDLCAFGVCAGLLALVCNDGDPCTDNACDPASGCVYEPIVDCTGAGGGGGTGGAGGSGGTGGGGHGGSGGEPNAEGGGGALPGSGRRCAAAWRRCGVRMRRPWGAWRRRVGAGSGSCCSLRRWRRGVGRGFVIFPFPFPGFQWYRADPGHVAIHPGDILAGYRSHALARSGGNGGGLGSRVSDETGREVAIKVLLARAALKPDLVKRFEREAEIASAINSPYVCQLIDVGQTDDDVPLLIFEYLAGESLADRLKREQYLPLSEVGPLIDDVLQGLVAAHAAGVIHRDLKPGNIYLEHTNDPQEDPERAKILDFGISKLSRPGKERADAHGLRRDARLVRVHGAGAGARGRTRRRARRHLRRGRGHVPRARGAAARSRGPRAHGARVAEAGSVGALARGGDRARSGRRASSAS